MSVQNHIIHSRGGKLCGDTTPGDVARIISKAMAHTDAGGIVLHFHGGLVNKDSGTEIAGRLSESYEQQAGAYPIFTVWEAGLFETLRNNLKEIAHEHLFRLIRERLIKIVKRKLLQNAGQRSGQQLPTVDIDKEMAALAEAATDPTLLVRTAPEIPDELSELTAFEQLQLSEELLHDYDLVTEIEKVSNGLLSPDNIQTQKTSRSGTVRSSTASLMDPDAIDQYIEKPDPKTRGFISTAKFVAAVVKIAGVVIKRMITDRDHGFHATIVEEILRALYIANAGQIVWSTMKKDTFDHFGPDANLYAGTAVLHELAEQLKTRDTPPKITLIGHSTGAVFISAFLEAADASLPPDVLFDVIYLAPAATMELTAKTLANQGHRIRNFRMFAMTDENEKADVLVDQVKFFYPHSLLYFVSGVVEDETDMPLTGMQRFYRPDDFPDTKFPDITPVRGFIQGDRVIWSVDDRGPGKKSSAVDHGEFDNNSDTIASICHILKNGY